MILDAVKRAEDGDGFVLRVYEAHGGRKTAVVTSAAEFSSARRVNLLEKPLADPSATNSLDASAHPVLGTTLRLTLRPFEVATILLRSAGGPDGSVRVEGGKL